MVTAGPSVPECLPLPSCLNNANFKTCRTAELPMAPQQHACIYCPTMTATQHELTCQTTAAGWSGKGQIVGAGGRGLILPLYGHICAGPCGHVHGLRLHAGCQVADWGGGSGWGLVA